MRNMRKGKLLSDILKVWGLSAWGLSDRLSEGKPQKLHLQRLGDGRYQVKFICRKKEDDYLVLLLPLGKRVGTMNPWYLLLTSCGLALKKIKSGDSIRVAYDPEVKYRRVSLIGRGATSLIDI